MSVIREKRHANNGCKPFESAIYYEFYIGDGFTVNINETNVTSTFTSNMTILYSLFFHSVHLVINMTSDTSSSVYILYIT